MKSCPHCKKQDQGFIAKGQMVGPVETYYDEDGIYEELNMDRAYWKYNSTVIRCANCLKIRRDVRFMDSPRRIEEM